MKRIRYKRRNNTLHTNKLICHLGVVRAEIRGLCLYIYQNDTLIMKEECSSIEKCKRKIRETFKELGLVCDEIKKEII